MKETAGRRNTWQELWEVCRRAAGWGVGGGKGVRCAGRRGRQRVGVGKLWGWGGQVVVLGR